MIRFGEVWKLYKKGLVAENDPISKEGLSKLVSKEGLKIAETVDPIVTFNSAEVLQQLSTISPENKDYSNSIGKLEGIINIIDDLEKKSFRFLESGAEDYNTYGHIVRLIKTGHEYDNKTVHMFNYLYSVFDKNYSELKDAESVDHIASARKKTDNIHSYCFRSLEIAKRRGIQDSLDSKNVRITEKYQRNKMKIAKIDEDINNLFTSYLTLSIDENPKKIIKRIRRKTRDGIFIKSMLSIRCRIRGYSEGLYRLNTLQKDIDYVLSNYDDISCKGKKIISSINKLHDYENIFQKTEHPLGINELEKMISVSQEYPEDRFSSYKDVLYLRSLIDEYASVSKNMQEKVKDALSHEKERENLARIADKNKKTENKRLPEADHPEAKPDNVVNRSFVLMDYLRDSPKPSSYRLLKLKDILEGRTGVNNLFERLNQFSDYLFTLGKIQSKDDKKFLEFVYEGIKKDVQDGSLGRLTSSSAYKKGIIDDTLNRFKEYVSSSKV